MSESPRNISSKRPASYRNLFRYSLRSLLVVTTLAAVACWWFLQPHVQDEELSGRFLKLRRQVRFLEGNRALDGPIKPTNDGYWQLRDENNELITAGRYQLDQPAEDWTVWHINGRKAAEGQAEHGVRSGVWKTWFASGVQESEVNYRVALFTPNPSDYEIVWWTYPHHLELRKGVPQFGFQAMRHGPAKQWHSNGQLRLDGNYLDDQREGKWTEYDDQGAIVEQGTYRADLREGPWSIQKRKVVFVAGRPLDEFNSQIEQIHADLTSDQNRRQVIAAAALEELGAAGAPVLAMILKENGSDTAKLLAIRSLARRDAVPQELLPQIEPLINHANCQLALQAMLALYRERLDKREVLFPRIIELVESKVNVDMQLVVLHKLCEIDTEQRPQTVAKLIALLARREKAMPQLAGVSMGIFGQSDPVSENCRALVTMDMDLIPHLERALTSAEVQVRHFVVKVLEDSIENRPPLGTTNLKNGLVEVTWAIPKPLKPLVEKAKLDADPAVREAAAGIGKRQLPPAPHGMGIF